MELHQLSAPMVIILSFIYKMYLFMNFFLAGFYQHLRQEIKEILKRCEEEELEQQRALNNLGKSQSSALVIHSKFMKYLII